MKVLICIAIQFSSAITLAYLTNLLLADLGFVSDQQAAWNALSLHVEISEELNDPSAR